MGNSQNDQTVCGKIVKKKLSLVSGFIVILLIILLLIGFSVRKSVTSPNSTSPSWRGIVPGKTSKQEVIKMLGQPDNIVKCEIVGEVTARSLVNCIFSPLTYEYKDTALPNGLIPTHKILFRAGEVWIVIEARFGAPEMAVEEFVELHGLPDKVAWSKLAPSLRDILFCERGMIIQGGKYISHIYYFQPMTLTQCLDEFNHEVSLTDPFPDSHFSGSRNPYDFGERK